MITNIHMEFVKQLCALFVIFNYCLGIGKPCALDQDGERPSEVDLYLDNM